MRAGTGLPQLWFPTSLLSVWHIVGAQNRCDDWQKVAESGLQCMHWSKLSWTMRETLWKSPEFSLSAALSSLALCPANSSQLASSDSQLHLLNPGGFPGFIWFILPAWWPGNSLQAVWAMVGFTCVLCLLRSQTLPDNQCLENLYFLHFVILLLLFQVGG